MEPRGSEFCGRDTWLSQSDLRYFPTKFLPTRFNIYQGYGTCCLAELHTMRALSVHGRHLKVVVQMRSNERSSIACIQSLDVRTSTGAPVKTCKFRKYEVEAAQNQRYEAAQNQNYEAVQNHESDKAHQVFCDVEWSGSITSFRSKNGIRSI
jgi:hypothetical protein